MADREKQTANADRLMALARQLGEMHGEIDLMFRADVIVPNCCDDVLSNLSLVIGQMRQIAMATDRTCMARADAE